MVNEIILGRDVDIVEKLIETVSCVSQTDSVCRILRNQLGKNIVFEKLLLILDLGRHHLRTGDANTGSEKRIVNKILNISFREFHTAAVE